MPVPRTNTGGWFVGRNCVGLPALSAIHATSVSDFQGFCGDGPPAAGPFTTKPEALAWIATHSGSTGPAPAGNPWYVIATAPSSHGFPGQTTVSQKPFPAGATELSGPYATKAEALAAANTAFPKGSAGSGVAHDISNPVGSFLGGFTQRQTWIRVAEVVLGIGLVLVGVLALTRDPANNAIGKALQVTPAGKGITSAAKALK